MKQKLNIAQSIFENQKLLLLDEPTNALDEQSVKDIYKLFHSLKKQGRTIFVASHDKEDLILNCDVIYEVKEGDGTVTTYWLELKDGTNVSPDCDAKVGTAYKTAAFSYANSENVYLTAENNNNGGTMYTVKGYWNPVSAY